MTAFATERDEMVERQIVARGVRDPAVLRAMRAVPREAFVPADLEEFAYLDTPLPIGEEQTISQPYIVAVMAELLEVQPGERVLDVGTGSGYAAAVLGQIADEVYTVERHASLADEARRRFEALGYDHIHVRHGDGTLGWPEHAPYDAVMVAAGGPDVPRPLLDQLAVGGRLVMPTGSTLRRQRLVRVRRTGEETYERENLSPVQFVPLIGAEGWGEPRGDGAPAVTSETAATLPERIRAACEPLSSADADEADLEALLDRIGEARVVCIGEATHGTSEFYAMRARITRSLIERRGFTIVAVEADWPDAARIDQYVREAPASAAAARPFSRFPTWMWANTDVLRFVEWLRAYNDSTDDPEREAGFFGLDLYSLYASIHSVLDYLEDVDPEAARIARQRYGCLTPYARDPATYGAAALTGRYRECEEEVVAMLKDLQDRQMQYAARDGLRFFDAVQNARLIASAEQYYRTMFYGGAASWNLRDEHMFDTLRALLDFRGPDARAVVWAHNSHLGDARATEMGARGQLNVGQLCREAFEDEAYLIGFGTHTGTVAAASDWDGPMEIKRVRPSREGSYERLCHDAGTPAFLLSLRRSHGRRLRAALLPEHLERAIGVIYRPETELMSHYFHASLPRQFDEYIWFDETEAVTPLGVESAEGMPDTFPFGV